MLQKLKIGTLALLIAAGLLSCNDEGRTTNAVSIDSAAINATTAEPGTMNADSTHGIDSTSGGTGGLTDTSKNDIRNVPHGK